MASEYVEFGVRFRLSADADGGDIEFQRLFDITREQVANLKPMSGVMSFAGGEGATTLPLGDIAEGYLLYLEATVDGYTIALSGGNGFVLKKRLTGGNAVALLMTSFTTITCDPGATAGDLSYCIAGV